MYFVRSSRLVKSIFPQAVWRKDNKLPHIYLTFDDGPVPEVTPWVIELLKNKAVCATFFCVGENIRKHPEVFRLLVEGGHKVGNHTFNHLNGWKTNKSRYISNIGLCEELIPSSNKLFRPPYGKISRSQLKELSNDYKIIMWDILSGDFDSSITPEQCLQNVCRNLRNGSIIVFHDSIKAKKNMEYCLPRFIDFALEKGYQFKCL